MRQYSYVFTAIGMATIVCAPVFSLFVSIGNLLYLAGSFMLLISSILSPAIPRSRLKSPSIIAVLGLFLMAWALVLLHWKDLNEQSLYDFMNMGLTIFMFLFTLITATEKAIKLGQKVIAQIGAAMAILLLHSKVGTILPLDGLAKSLTADIYNSYLTVSFVVGAGVIISFLAFIMETSYTRFYWLLIGLICFAGLSISIGRGPIIFSVIVLIVAFVSHRRHDLVKIQQLVVIAVMPILAFIAFNAAIQNDATGKWTRMLDIQAELSEGGRGELWSRSFDAINSSPILGWGMSSSGVLVANDINNYPHNFFLQIWIDAGLFPVLLFCVFFGIIFYKSLKFMIFGWAGRDLTPFFLFTFTFLNFMKSYSAYESRVLFLFGASSILLFFEFVRIKTTNSVNTKSKISRGKNE